MLLSCSRKVSLIHHIDNNGYSGHPTEPHLFLTLVSLDSRVPERSAAIRASGLTPEKFAAAERDFRTAVQSVSSSSAQALSGPSDAVNSSFAASLSAAPTTRPIRPSPLAATPGSASKSKADLLAKAQAIQAGSLFDQTMRSVPDKTPSKSAGKEKATVTDATVPAVLSQMAANVASNESTEQANAAVGDTSLDAGPRRNKRRRMGRVVFGLAIHSSLNRLDEEQEADDERNRRNRINHIQSTIERLGSSNPTWRYLDAPRDFFVSISPSSENASVQ